MLASSDESFPAKPERRRVETVGATGLEAAFAKATAGHAPDLVGVIQFGNRLNLKANAVPADLQRDPLPRAFIKCTKFIR
jgi:hypothetical protein